MRSVSAPVNKRILVKLAASIAPDPRANRHKTEFAAKAISASVVKRSVFINVGSEMESTHSEASDQTANSFPLGSLK